MLRMRLFAIIVVGSFLIATGVGIWAASMTNHPAVGLRTTHVADSSEWGPADGSPLFKP